MTNTEKVKSVLTKWDGICDDCLSIESKVKPRQSVNQICRSLTQTGLCQRSQDKCDCCGSLKILNRIQATKKGSKEHGGLRAVNGPITTRIQNHDVDALSEDEIKEVLNKALTSNGWETQVAWGKARGVDIDAHRDTERWLIEVKGPGSRQPMRVNYFLGILGETLQRMEDSSANYSIALPDLQQYRRLWERLPELAKSRTQITALFVNKKGEIDPPIGERE